MAVILGLTRLVTAELETLIIEVRLTMVNHRA